MIRRSLPRRAVTVLPMLVMLCACTASPSITGNLGANSAGLRIRPASGSSGDLLYVSDWQDGAIYIFSYPDGTLLNTIADDASPLGLCSDAGGNVWVTNFGAASNQIVEYAHGGTTPIATLDDPNEEPRGCSVNPKNGDLAIANGDPGNVVIYSHASGSPAAYSPGLSYPFSCSYDGSGNLFVDGYRLRYSDKFALSELRSGASGFVRIGVNATLGLPGNIQWDGTYLAVGDYPLSATIYRLAIEQRRTAATLEGTVALEGPTPASPRGVQFLIRGSTLVMPFGTNKRVTNVGFWQYPAGGDRFVGLHGFGGSELYGVAVSALPGSSHPVLR